MVKLGFVFMCVGFLACSKDLASIATTTSSSGAAAPTAAAPKDKTVDLAPLPLVLTMASDETAMTMDMSMGEIKSVSMSYDAISAGLNVSSPIEKSFNELKKDNKNDKFLFPFKRWVKEGPTTAIEEFTSEGKSGFLAISWKEIGGKSYVCKSNGLSGLKTVEDAEKVLKTCDTLRAK